MAWQRLEQLEARELLAAPIEGFETTVGADLPAAWGSWTSDPNGTVQVADGVGLNGSAALRIDGTSKVAARAWDTETKLRDATIQTTVFLDSLIPVQLLGRGSDLNQAGSDYYALSIERGLKLELLRVVDGRVTVLATLKSAQYFSQKWVQVELTLDGDELRASVIRLDSMQSLQTNGTWGDSRVDALTAYDTAISDAGYAGIGRTASYAGKVAVDNFQLSPILQPKSYTPPLPSPAAEAPASLAVEETATVSAMAPAPSTITDPRHYEHIQVAQLAYDGTPQDAAFQTQLKNSVDLVIPNQKYFDAIEKIAPDTPQAIYSNTSNLYEDLLTDWLSYATQKNVDRESAFYHVAESTPWRGSSPSSKPVDQFWKVGIAQATDAAPTTWLDRTFAAYSTTANDVAAPKIGEALYLAFPEKFREINLQAVKAFDANYSGWWEYGTLDADGKVVWKRVDNLQSELNGDKTLGTLRFDPAADWKAISIAGASKADLFWVRFRPTEVTGAVPTLSRVFGRDYVQSVKGLQGVIPAFDSNADRNGDGYLSDAEFANHQNGKDARFVYESRLFYPYYGQQRFVTNPASTAFRNWSSDYTKRLLDANPLADAVFLDNSNGKLPLDGAKVLESTANYTADFRNLVAQVDSALGPNRRTIANTVAGGTASNEVAKVADITFEEFAIRSQVHSASQFRDLSDLVTSRLAANPNGKLILDSHPMGGSITEARTQIGTLAYYYLLADPERTYLMFFGGNEPASSWERHWVDAAAYDVGKPLASWKVFATGIDPASTTQKLNYEVISRSYSNALVLYKPVSAAGQVKGTTDDASATTHDLGGMYRVLQANGTLGAVVNKITLRNGEGAILIPVR